MSDIFKLISQQTFVVEVDGEQIPGFTFVDRWEYFHKYRNAAGDWLIVMNTNPAGTAIDNLSGRQRVGSDLVPIAASPRIQALIDKAYLKKVEDMQFIRGTEKYLYANSILHAIAQKVRSEESFAFEWERNKESDCSDLKVAETLKNIANMILSHQTDGHGKPCLTQICADTEEA